MQWHVLDYKKILDLATYSLFLRALSLGMCHGPNQWLVALPTGPRALFPRNKATCPKLKQTLGLGGCKRKWNQQALRMQVAAAQLRLAAAGST